MKSELIGLDILESHIVKCKKCGVRIAEVILTETNESRNNRGFESIRSSYQFLNCHKCKDGSSYRTPIINGSCCVGSLSDDYIIETEDTDVIDDEVVVNLKIINKRK